MSVQHSTCILWQWRGLALRILTGVALGLGGENFPQLALLRAQQAVAEKRIIEVATYEGLERRPTSMVKQKLRGWFEKREKELEAAVKQQRKESENAGE